MAQLHKMKKGLPLSTGMLSDVAPPTPLSKRRNREDFAPRLPVTGEYGRSDDEDDDENEPQPMSIAEMRERTAMAIQAEANRAQSPTAAELQKLLRPKH